MDSELIALLPVWYAAFLLSLTGHEAAHAWVARRGGDETAYLSGQVTLNPWPHVRREPIGTIAVPLVTFFLYGWMMGWASAPYDPRWEDSHPRRAAAMSAAGPAANVFLFALAFIALKGGLAAGWWVPPSQASLALDRLVEPAAGMPAVLEAIGRFLSVLFCLNLILGVLQPDTGSALGRRGRARGHRHAAARPVPKGARPALRRPDRTSDRVAGGAADRPADPRQGGLAALRSLTPRLRSFVRRRSACV